MADDAKATAASPASPAGNGGARLEGGTYEIIRARLREQGDDLRARLERLDGRRKQVFGSIEAALLNTDRVVTSNNCVPRDMVELGDHFLFGYNVHIGLRSEMRLDDVFAVYAFAEGGFRASSLDGEVDEQFIADFRELYRYYRHTTFSQFRRIGPNLYMVFQVGKTAADIKAFKWLVSDEGQLTYQGNRFDHEVQCPSQHEFTWVRTGREMHHTGQSPHVSIMDRIFVETVGGDLTIKVEDNTDVGEGIYSEPVDDPDQTLDDAEILYADVGNLILLKVRPYQEHDFRYFVYSEKVQQVVRIDALADSCVLLPEGHGVIFSKGYYLQNGEHKTFDSDMRDMRYLRRVAAPNGEDFLYIFCNVESGTYVLLSYNLIRQTVLTPIICHGYSLFADGRLCYFKADEKPRKTHAIHIWRTPFVQAGMEQAKDTSSYLYKIGNGDIVRCMASCHEILNLLNRDDTYANLYVDIVHHVKEVLDAYFWLDHEEAQAMKVPLTLIGDAAKAAIEEFEKVVRLKQTAIAQTAGVERKLRELVNALRLQRFDHIRVFVDALASLRAVRGGAIALKELRYVDLQRVDAVEQQVAEQSERQARNCVAFLLRPDALTPYLDQVAEVAGQIESLTKVTDAQALEKTVGERGGELEMLIDTVSNLKIDDTTQRTEIVDRISQIFSSLNRVRALLKNRLSELASAEGQAEFASQVKLLSQAVINYLDVCDTPAKCEDYLGKVMVQVEELEGRFAEYDAFVVELTEKREEIYQAFEARKQQLMEARNKRADGLARSALRILKGIRARALTLASVEEINGYFASDLMIAKVRDIVDQLDELGDSVKSGDVQTQLKSIREDTVRQLKDRKELFVEGENVIRFGRHRFAVNTQPLDLTLVRRDEAMFLHLTGTDFFEAINDPDFVDLRDVWDQPLVSESADVYRGEFLAYRLLQRVSGSAAEPDATTVRVWSEEELLGFIQAYMGPRYSEGYVKGVTDLDVALLLRALLEIHCTAGLLRFSPQSRALAILGWQVAEDDRKPQLAAKIGGFGELLEVFRAPPEQPAYTAELRELLAEAVGGRACGDDLLLNDAAAYLFEVLVTGGKHPISDAAAELHGHFMRRLKRPGAQRRFTAAQAVVAPYPLAHMALLCDWLDAFLAEETHAEWGDVRDEVAALLLTDQFDSTRVQSVACRRRIEGFAGSHGCIEQGVYALDYHRFMRRLAHHDAYAVPRFQRFQVVKKSLVDRAREEMRLEEFRPRVLTSFVRNQLIDRVYLPLVGDNLAKQIGVVGADTRTDRMGMLLLISPPGYGKTTLMEYIANRLGIIFMKINGPAIGHQVTSLDPAESPNAAAREELKKLNLALEMGDNIMLYLDDIQHCNPELLQKFISLCDAQRKIEGVYKGRTRTYDLRGKSVAVVMAGNPYTESGEMFKVPDMLANRADTYNLGDIIGGSAEAFELSYLENALTSNPVLNKLASRSRKDIYGIITIAQHGTREGVELEGNYSADELSEFVSVMKKLLRIRDVVLRVNQAYIRSASQADEFRTEPPFKLQGSYRNMNRLAERVQPIMNAAELEGLLDGHYENEAQTLTTGAEANLLKYKAIMGKLDAPCAERWEMITRTYGRNQLLSGTDADDKAGQVIVQLSTLSDGLKDIGRAVAGMHPADDRSVRLDGETLEVLRQALASRAESAPVAGAETPATPDASADDAAVLRFLEQQFALLQGWQKPGEPQPDTGTLRARMADAAEHYHRLLRQVGLGESVTSHVPHAEPTPTAPSKPKPAARRKSISSAPRKGGDAAT